MIEQFDILIRQARLRHRADLVDIGILNGRIHTIAPTLNGRATTELFAQGNLVTESFANPHLHLCKVYTRQRMDDLAMQAYHHGSMGKAMNATYSQSFPVTQKLK